MARIVRLVALGGFAVLVYFQAATMVELSRLTATKIIHPEIWQPMMLSSTDDKGGETIQQSSSVLDGFLLEKATIRATTAVVTTTSIPETRETGSAVVKSKEDSSTRSNTSGQAAAHLHSPCPHVEMLYNRAPILPNDEERSQWDMSKERILLLSGHGAPLADTVHDLLEMGFPPESLYSVCMYNYCWLLPYSGYVVQESGLGVGEWSDRHVTGTDKTMLQAVQQILLPSQDRWWQRGFGADTAKNYDKFFRAMANKDETQWDGGIQQDEYNKELGDAMSHFTAVICVFPSKYCLPFLDDKYSHLKVILRLSHRISHWDLKSDHTLSFLKRLASHPSRFLVASNNAFDMAAMESLSSGNNWVSPRRDLPLTGLDPINLQVLFWPSYYRHVRDFIPEKQQRSNPPLVIEVGASYNQITLVLFQRFRKKLNDSGKHNWILAERSLHNMTEQASLAIVFPYSTHSAKVNELYAHSIPMIAPSIDLLLKLGKTLQPSKVQPHIGMSDQFLSQVKPPKLCFSNASSSPLHHWTAWSDVYTHPFLHYFDSFEELPKKIDGLFDNPDLLQETRANMKQYWDKSYNKTSKVVLATLENLFSN